MTKTKKTERKVKAWAVIDRKGNKFREVLPLRLGSKPNVFLPEEYYVPCTITYSLPSPTKRSKGKITSK